MSPRYAFLFILFTGTFSGYSQALYKHFEVRHQKGVNKVDLHLTTKAGASQINAFDDLHPVFIYGGNENDIATSSFKMEVNSDRTQSINATLACKDHAGDNFSEALAANIFSSESTGKDLWQVYLSRNTSFDLDLTYLVGSSQIDLSGLAVEKLKIHSGSADVFVKYSDEQPNFVAMDTFFIKVNLGNIDVKNLDLITAKEIIAEVGFGSINLECGSSWKMNSRVNASVGAGSMDIVLPEPEVPVLIRLNDSPLCRVKMAPGFQKVGHNTYGNEAYRLDKTNSIEFSLDVGMGSISFLDK